MRYIQKNTNVLRSLRRRSRTALTLLKWVTTCELSTSTAAESRVRRNDDQVLLTILELFDEEGLQDANFTRNPRWAARERREGHKSSDSDGESTITCVEYAAIYVLARVVSPLDFAPHILHSVCWYRR